jgi:hypothetical protein
MASPPKDVVYELLSLDGVAEKCEDFITDWDDVMAANLTDVIGSQDAVILGRRSHEEWAGFWSVSEIEPFATFINTVQKFVATSTPLDRDWANSTAIDGGLVDLAMTQGESSPTGHLVLTYSVTGQSTP